jgi:hypothetical protein
VETPSDPIAVIRRILLLALILGLLGTGTELLLLEHFEDWWQLAPIVLIGCALAVLFWHAIDRRRALPIRALQIIMILSAVSGSVGVLLHYRGNAEFELEMYPSMAGLELFRKSMMGATPALAPGTMILLALVGLAYAHRHPRLATNETGGKR